MKSEGFVHHEKAAGGKTQVGLKPAPLAQTTKTLASAQARHTSILAQPLGKYL